MARFIIEFILNPLNLISLFLKFLQIFLKDHNQQFLTKEQYNRAIRSLTYI